MSNTPLVSVIVPVYNAALYLKRCLDSIIRQTYKDLEIIIINDGSTDASLMICHEYESIDNRIAVINTSNLGVSAARNTGIGNSTGTFTTFVDADDWLENNAIESMMSAFSPKVDCVRSSYFLDDGKGKEMQMSPQLESGLYSGHQLNNLMNVFAKGEEPCYTPLLMIRSKYLSQVRFDESLRFLEDKVFYLKLLDKLNNIFILKTPTYHYFYNQKSASRSVDKNYDRIVFLLSAHESILQITNDLTPATLQKLYDDHFYILKENLSLLFAMDRRKFSQTLRRLKQQQSYQNFLSLYAAKSAQDKNLKSSLKRLFALSATKNISVFMYTFLLFSLFNQRVRG